MKRLDLKSICRICARKDNSLKSMFLSVGNFSPHFCLADMFVKLTGIEIIKNDRISHLICKRCSIVLTSAMLLRRLALATNHKLQMRVNKLSKFEAKNLKSNEVNCETHLETPITIEQNNVDSRSKSDSVIDIDDYEKQLFAKYFPKTAESMSETPKSDKTDVSNISNKEESHLNCKRNAGNKNDESIKNNDSEKKLFLKYFPQNSERSTPSNNDSLDRHNELDLFKKYFPENHCDRDKFETSLFDDSSHESTFYEDAPSNSDSHSLNTDETCKLSAFHKMNIDSNKNEVQKSESNDHSTKPLIRKEELDLKSKYQKDKSRETLSDMSKNEIDLNKSYFLSTERSESKSDESRSTDNLMQAAGSYKDSNVIDRDKIERDVMTLLKNGYLYVTKRKTCQTLAKSRAKKPYNFEDQSRRYKSILVGPYRGADVPAQCKICKKVLATVRSLKKHAQVHFGFTHICEYCGHGFRTYAAMDAHMMARHGKEKKFVCQYCQHRACSKHELQEHELSHTGVRPYICDTCGKNFARRPCLVKHIGRIHTAVKSFKCEQCGKQFFSSADLRNHDNSVHVRRFMYECGRCGTRYAKRASVRQHLAGTHGVPRETQGHVKRVCVL